MSEKFSFDKYTADRGVDPDTFPAPPDAEGEAPPQDEDREAGIDTAEKGERWGESFALKFAALTEPARPSPDDGDDDLTDDSPNILGEESADFDAWRAAVNAPAKSSFFETVKAAGPADFTDDLVVGGGSDDRIDRGGAA